MKRILLILLLVATYCYSAPVIDEVTHDSESGAWTITSTGSSFGAGSVPLIWDDFEDGTLDAVLESSPKVGTWIPFGTRTIYSNNQANSGTQSAYSLRGAPGEGLMNVKTSVATNTIIQTSNKLFVSMHWRIYNADTGQVKLIQEQGNGSPVENDYGPGIFPGGSTGTYITYSTTSSLTDNGYLNHGQWPSAYSDEEEWHRIEMILERSTNATADGTIFIILDNTYYSSNYDGNIMTRKDGQDWEEFQFLRSGSNATVEWKYWIDDLCFNNSWARVEVGNNAVYADCTERHIQAQTSWDTDEVVAAQNQGNFDDETTYYLFIIDEDNDPSDGYAITFGETPTDSGKIIIIGGPGRTTLGQGIIILGD